MNERIRKMKADIERRGGVVYFPKDAPDEILEAFFRDVLACPCCAVVRGKGKSLETIRTRNYDSARGHRI